MKKYVIMYNIDGFFSKTKWKAESIKELIKDLERHNFQVDLIVSITEV